jgi:hypothetical protein
MERRTSYREHRRNVRKHFAKRWRERTATPMPDYDALMAEFRLALSGRSTKLKKLRRGGGNSTIWLASTGGEDILIAYCHDMMMPKTVLIPESIHYTPPRT